MKSSRDSVHDHDANKGFTLIELLVTMVIRSVVAGMAAGFRRCYNNGLKEDPNMKGSVRVTARIGPNGEVLSASASGGGGH